MPTPTTRLGLNKPNGNEFNTRTNFNAILDQIDAAVARAQDLIALASDLTGGNFVVSGLGYSVSGLVVTIAAGSCYVNGTRLTTVSTPLTIPASTTQYIYVDTDGVVKQTPTLATAQAKLYIYSVTAGTSTISSYSDQRNINAPGSKTSTANSTVIRDTNADVTARRFVSTATTGTSPFSVSSTTVVTNLNTDQLDGLHADDISGARYVFNAPAQDQWILIATLPVSGSTYDKLFIDLIGGPDQASTGLTNDWIFMGNKGGFAYQYDRFGVDTNNSRANLRVMAYRQADNSVKVYLKAVAAKSTACILSAWGINLTNNTTVIVPAAATTTAPTGTLVFDSGDATNYPANAGQSFGSLQLNSQTAPLQLPNLSTFPAIQAAGTICVVNGKSYISTGTTWRNTADQLTNFKKVKSGKDANGIFTVVDYRRLSDDTLYMRSTLSNPDAKGNYQTDTRVFYKADGTTTDYTVTVTLTYDADGDLLSEVPSA